MKITKRPFIITNTLRETPVPHRSPDLVCQRQLRILMYVFVSVSIDIILTFNRNILQNIILQIDSLFEKDSTDENYGVHKILFIDKLQKKVCKFRQNEPCDEFVGSKYFRLFANLKYLKYSTIQLNYLYRLFEATASKSFYLQRYLVFERSTPWWLR